jgi:hypothetical protein
MTVMFNDDTDISLLQPVNDNVFEHAKNAGGLNSLFGPNDPFR